MASDYRLADGLTFVCLYGKDSLPVATCNVRGETPRDALKIAQEVFRDYFPNVKGLGVVQCTALEALMAPGE